MLTDNARCDVVVMAPLHDSPQDRDYWCLSQIKAESSTPQSFDMMPILKPRFQFHFQSEAFFRYQMFSNQHSTTATMHCHLITVQQRFYLAFCWQFKSGSPPDQVCFITVLCRSITNNNVGPLLMCVFQMFISKIYYLGCHNLSLKN